MSACPECQQDGWHRDGCPNKYALVAAETLQPDAAQKFVARNVDRLPREFVLYVAYGRLFHGMHRASSESEIMDAIMKLLSYNYQVVIEKDDPMMRLALKCRQQWRGGEEIAGPTMGKIIG